jgi:hypothetical protein
MPIAAETAALLHNPTNIESYKTSDQYGCMTCGVRNIVREMTASHLRLTLLLQRRNIRQSFRDRRRCLRDKIQETDYTVAETVVSKRYRL